MPNFKVSVSPPDVRPTSGNRSNVVVNAPDEETAGRLAAGMVGQGIVHSVTEYKPPKRKRPKTKTSKPKATDKDSEFKPQNKTNAAGK